MIFFHSNKVICPIMVSYEKYCVFLHHGLAGGELGKNVVWILVVVCCCRDGRVQLAPDADVLCLDGLVPLVLLRHHGELVAKHLPRKDLECCRDQPGGREVAFQSHFKVFLKSLFEDRRLNRGNGKSLTQTPLPWFL